MKSRLPLPTPDTLDRAQRAVYDSILSTRGNLNGPFLAWMHSPTLAAHAEKLGAFCRYQTVFELVESEILILVVAAHFHCLGEQQIHEPIAASAGLSTDNITLIRQGRQPRLATPRQMLLHAVAEELLRKNHITPGLYAEGVQQFGERGIVELVGIVGYYALVAMTLNAFEMHMD
jgi:4-carboxymuconolactone decarboxylase